MLCFGTRKSACSDMVKVQMQATGAKMATLIRKVKSDHDSTGGTATCVCTNVPAGLGEPCFDKLEAMLAHGMMSLPATKGFEIGSGFSGTKLRGSQHNDPFKASASNGIGSKRKTMNGKSEGGGW